MKWTVLLSILFFISGCSYTIKVKDGDTAFDRYQYAKAITFYKKDLERSKSRVDQGRIALKLAESFQKLNQPAAALPYYQMAWTNQAGIAALKGKANSLKMLERYEEAIEAFNQLGEEIGSTYEFRKEIQACSLAQAWITEQSPNHFVLDEIALNSKYADYGPFLFSDGSIAFTSDRPSAQSKDFYSWTGKPYSDVLVTNPNESSILTAPSFLAKINTAANEGNFVQSADLTTIYFTRCGEESKNADQYCRIFSMQQTVEGWSDPLILSFCTGNFNYGHAFPSNDGKSLFFASDDPLGFGGYDLYKVDRSGDSWTDPAILPPTINTTGDEMFPYIVGDTLYFASDFHPGMGGLDVFKTYRTGVRTWSVPENLKPPFNSGADDFGLIWAASAENQPTALRTGYISSTRPGGKGDDDIYKIREQIPPPPDTTKPTFSNFRFVLNIYALTPIYKIPSDPNSTILGRKILSGAKLAIRGHLDTVFLSSETSPATFEIFPGNRYTISASAEGYLNTEISFDASEISVDSMVAEQQFDIEILLDKLFIDQEIVLENIYYDFDRWEIRSDAKPTLVNLAQILFANPGITIELASHTDCRGSANYNQELSQRRAQSAVDFLISIGVEPNRLRAMGYGESRPSTDCPCNRCSEAEHQQNRRTTFRILEN
jgi:peptidoglycan-associated lipoprotein